MLAECIALGLFLAGLGLCIFTGIQILYALLFGLLCFSVYCLSKGYSARDTGAMLWEGISQVKNILIIFVLIGGLTAVWRICGTIPYILYHGAGLIHPRYFVLCTFLLCSFMSFLTGTSFGTASTMGVICMLISNTAGLSPFLTGGAILSGSFFGDRCSPMSSSAQLICSLTRTDIYLNMKLMCRSCAVPFAVTCVLYVVLASGSGATVALFLQGTAPLALLRCFLNGYQAEAGTRLAQLLNGGGIRSMVKVGIIVLISASYSGIFSHTCLLSGVKHALLRSARHLTPFGTVLVTSILSCAVSCNQSLATILTCQMCDGLYPKKEKLALALEDTAILIAALIPWGIAGAVPVAAIGAPMGCMFWAFYLYLVPLWNLFAALYHDRIRAGRTAFTSFM